MMLKLRLFLKVELQEMLINEEHDIPDVDVDMDYDMQNS